jgi:hypothetical protein
MDENPTLIEETDDQRSVIDNQNVNFSRNCKSGNKNTHSNHAQFTRINYNVNIE